MMQQQSIESVVDLYYGGPSKGSTDPTSGPRIVRPADFKSGSASDAHYVSEYIDLDTARRLEVGDIVVALAGPIGTTMIVSEELAGSVLGRWCAALRARSDQALVTQTWLFAWTQSSDFRQQVETWTMPATMPRLPEPALRSFVVPIPTLEQQRELEVMMEVFDGALHDLENSLRLTKELRGLEIDALVNHE